MDMNYSHLIQTPFLVRPSPYSQESPLGYILRVAEDNGWTSHESLVRQVPATAEGKATYIWQVATSDPRMQEIERLLVKPAGSVAELAYGNVSQGRVTERHFRHTVLPADMFEFGAARFCPQCLEASPHRRDLWDIAPLQSCAEHGLLLQLHCPHCGARQKWTATGTTTCGKCFGSLLNAPREEAPAGLRWLAGMAAALLDGSERPTASNLFLGNATNFLEVVRLLALFVSGEGCQGRDLPALPNLDPDAARQTYETVAVALQNWPASAPGILRAQVAKQWQQYPALGSQPWEKRANRILSRGSYADARYSPWVSPLREALAALPSAAPAHHGSGAANNAAPIGDAAADLLSFQEAAKLFGVSIKTIRLAHAQAILTSLGLLVRNRAAKSVDGKQLDALFEKVHGTVRGRPTSETITLAKMQTTLLGRRGRDIWDVVQAVTNGEIAPVTWPRGTPLSEIEFDLAEAMRFLGELPISVNGYTIPDAAEKLKCLTDALRRVIKAGLLKAPRVRCPDGHHRQIVPIKELERFDACYVFSATLAKEVGDEPRRFAEKLMDEGVKPASGPGIDGGLMYVFRRNDLENIDIQVVARKTAYNKRCGRKTKKNTEELHREFVAQGLLTAAEAARLLGASVQQVSRLATQGYLAEFDHDGKLGNRRYFCTTDVNGYLAAYRDNPALIPEKSAAESLGISLARFRASMIRSGKIAVISDGLNRYVRRAEICRTGEDVGTDQHSRDSPRLDHENDGIEATENLAAQ